MSLLVLTARPQLRSNARLVEAGKEIGIQVILRDAVPLVASMSSERMRLEMKGHETGIRSRAVLARVGNWRPETMLALLGVCCASGMSTLNPVDSIRKARDHWQTLEVLARAGVPIPRSLAGMDPERTCEMAADLLGFPVVVKLRRSRMGVGVMKAESLDQLEALVDSFWRLGEEFMLQEFMACGGRSLRLLSLCDEILAAAEFSAPDGMWRSNGSRGGKAVAVKPETDLIELAVRASRVLGLGLAGVDLLQGPDGPVVCEVNPTPGFFHLENATGKDIAAAIVKAAVSQL